MQPMLMIIQNPDIDVLGITIESGDGWQKEEVSQTLRMLELIGRTDIPVAAGATFPLVNSQATLKLREKLYGAVPYKGAWMEEWPSYNTMQRRTAHGPDIVPPRPEGAPSIRRIDDGFAARAKEIVLMGGGHLLGVDLDKPQDEFAMQLAYNPRQSFNFYWDPEAAHIVLTSLWRHVTLVTDDAPVPTSGTAELIARATASHRPVARYIAQIAQAGFPLWDESAAAAWLDPHIVTRRGTLAIDVQTEPGAHYGGLLTWPAGKGPGLGERDVDVVYGVDVPMLNRMFVDLLGR
jgi:inosine-uridine nucleoside N-ribohydrolase